ncbi:MAG: sigma 54-interacting transcriptional regulator, partial [Firmicutes bacterium]|nr:sigma 54-interacting transcriptional regulator [Bacillota bacterium]
VDMVVAFSIDEILLENIVNEMTVEKNNAKQLLSYLSNSDNKNVPIVAESRAMQEIIALLARISQVDSTVLLTGESGTGKEVLSRFIHKSSPRSAEVFIPVNCAAIPSELMESEFFGYARGAFTGATREGKAGFFELADNGTLFLDEIAEMPLAIQSKFLRVLETGDVKRLGAEKDKHVNVRVIAATNKNLYKMVQEGLFREDLYYRLNVIPIRIPPLRERPADILPLAKVFLNNFNRKYGLNRIFSNEAVKKLQSYPWPGNVRELRNVIERLVIASDSNILSFHSSDRTPVLKITEQFYSGTDSVPDADENEGRSLKEIMREYEQKVVLSTIDHYNGSVAKAATALKLHKSALYRKLESYNKDTLM